MSFLFDQVVWIYFNSICGRFANETDPKIHPNYDRQERIRDKLLNSPYRLYSHGNPFEVILDHSGLQKLVPTVIVNRV